MIDIDYEHYMECFATADNLEKQRLLDTLCEIYKHNKNDAVINFIANVILDDSQKMSIRKSAACDLYFSNTHIPLEIIKKIYNTTKFQFDMSGCLSYCEDEERHAFAIDILKKKPNEYIASGAVFALVAEKITTDEAELLKVIYAESKNLDVRYAVLQVLSQCPVNNLGSFFLDAYKRERTIHMRFKAIIVSVK